MNRTLLVLAVSFSLLAGTPVISILADEASDSQDAQRAANDINDESDSDSGREAVSGRLRDEFNVEESVINGLRSQNMGYGEIGIALSLAEQMPGGITNENIQKVMDLRQADAKTGWGNAAKQLNLNLGKAVSQAKKIANERQTIETPDTQQTQSRESAQSQSQRPVSTGKPAGVIRPPHIPGGGGPKGKR